MKRKPARSPHSNRVHVLVAGQKIDAAIARHAPESIQKALQDAKQRFGSALCTCQPSPLQLVIRERAGRLFLACWPDQSGQHALDCPFYSNGDGGSTQYQTGAITSDGPITNLTLHHPVSQRRSSPRSNGNSSAPRPANGLAKLHIWGLFHHLWEGAGINRWFPGWRRDWGFVRNAVRRVAQSTEAEGQPLLPALYVPPFWTLNRQEEISANWKDFIRPLNDNNRSNDTVLSGFVIGVVRKLEPTPHGFIIRLQHHAPIFFIDKASSDRLASYSRRGWAALRMMRKEGDSAAYPVVVAALRVQAVSNRSLTVVEGALMRTSRDFIPVTSSYEERVAELLVEQQRAFIKPLHYDAHNLDLAHFVLTDCAKPNSSETGPQKCAMFVYGSGIDPSYQTNLEARDRDIARRMGCTYWQWNTRTTADVPPFPPVHVTPLSPLSTTQPSTGASK